MSPSITLKGAMKFSIKKIISGSVTISEYKGPGEILMAPPFLGDITTLRIEEGKEWNVGKDAFLAATVGVQKEVKGQGSIGNAMLSGEGYFVYRVAGTGIMWISSFGAIVRKDVSQALHRSRVWPPNSSSSYNPKRNISSTTVTWWHGTARMSWSEQPAGA